MAWRRRPRLHLQRTLLLFAALRLATDWNPWHWFVDAKNTAADIEQQIQDWVINVVLEAAGLISNDINTVFNWAHDSINAVISGMNHAIKGLADYVNSVAASIRQDFWGALDGVNKFIQWVADDARSFATNLVNLLKWGVDTEIHNVVNWFNGIVQSVRDVTNTLIDNALRVAEDYASKAAQWLWINVVAPAIAPLLAAYRDTVDIITWFKGGVLDTWHIIERATSWLVWFAENPLTAIDQFETDLIGALKGTGQSAYQGAVNKWVGRLESTIGDFFGVK